MLHSVIAENYKSLKFIDVDVGTFNVLIGENGAGKSNFLEIIASYSAIIANSFTNEYLQPRGIRVAEHRSIFSCFAKDHSEEIQFIIIEDNGIATKIFITYDENNPYSPLNYELSFLQQSLEDNKKFEVINIKQLEDMSFHKQVIDKVIEKYGSAETMLNLLKGRLDELNGLKETSNSPSIMDEDFDNIVNYLSRMSTLKNIMEEYNRPKDDKNSHFVIYSPELSSLRNFSTESQIEPLGVNGEGLLKLLQVMQKHEPENFGKVCEIVEMFQWVEKIIIESDSKNIEKHIKIIDRFMGSEIDHRSANEGFLFVLFYAALFSSKFTPKCFAVDNIDASLNPKLCRVLVKELIKLAKENDKQAFVTTHNPAILDGLDLHDDEQRLFVVERDDEGATQLRRVGVDDLPKPTRSGQSIKLSESFMRGFLGGLPTNF
ncbi:AAA family ATPase [Acinetobacter baumannii]|uniref:AAA family ATPase n=1 Tax=Acinetobacter baumannii TaxID=470 RepID=A0A506K1N8_ACIBA|nr:AAA family ATPase [Acinetobacter baumannii]KMV11340.1 AAA ATPase domain protein [Acinetobacter baumannii]MCG6617881.1 AAA family ATPase [Acinetobacter baumannii]MEE1858220.1 AAA family ATPase [Acinetobacter baumannii]NDM17952.1 AAA family ATPase [Acinetobacter baumannii]NDW41714.1 AAA family ATPase [Acinetobacter baumannii]